MSIKLKAYKLHFRIQYWVPIITSTKSVSSSLTLLGILARTLPCILDAEQDPVIMKYIKCTARPPTFKPT